MRTFTSGFSISGLRAASMTSTFCVSHRCLLMWWRACGLPSHSLSVLIFVRVDCCILLLTVFIRSILFCCFSVPQPHHTNRKEFPLAPGSAEKGLREALWRPDRAVSHLLHPGRFGSVEQMILAGTAAAILHNMVVEQRRGGFVAHKRMAAAGATRDEHLGPPVVMAMPVE